MGPFLDISKSSLPPVLRSAIAAHRRHVALFHNVHRDPPETGTKVHSHVISCVAAFDRRLVISADMDMPCVAPKLGSKIPSGGMRAAVWCTALLVLLPLPVRLIRLLPRQRRIVEIGLLAGLGEVKECHQ